MQRKRSTRRSYTRRKKTWTQKCKDYIRNFVAFMFSNIGIIGLVIGYTIAGSFMFIAIEGSESSNRLNNVLRLRNSTVARLWRTTYEINVFEEASWRERVEDELRAFQSTIVQEVRIYGYEGEKYTGNKWTFSGAFLYSLTVITTIGYGNVAPRTELGKFATVVYAIVGMPLFLLYLSNIGDVLAKSFKWTYAKCCLCTSCQFRRTRDPSVIEAPGNLEEGSEDSSIIYDPQSVTVPLTLCLAIMVGYVYGGALLFVQWEKWEPLDGAYFCFISLSTIGFGDIVPGDVMDNGEGVIELSFIFCSMYLLLGMALIAMCFNLMQEEVVHKIRSCGNAVRRITRCTR